MDEKFYVENILTGLKLESLKEFGHIPVGAE
jgi:hypothetical protein